MHIIKSVYKIDVNNVANKVVENNVVANSLT